jgi:hypothetical protein
MWSDDDLLLAALADAVRAVPDVPRDFIEQANDAYAWRTIDAEFAALVYDSTLADNASGSELAGALSAASGTRSEPAVLRALTFSSPRLMVELHIGTDGLLGLISPPRDGDVEVQFASGETVEAPIDDVGWFAVRPAPPTPFRLRLRTSDGADVLTGWVTA